VAISAMRLLAGVPLADVAGCAACLRPMLASLPVQRINYICAVAEGERAADEYVPLTLEMLEEDMQPALLALVIVTGYILLGTIFYWHQTSWTLIDAAYFVCVTLSSVGYGDLTPEGDSVKLFTCAYLILGFAVFGTALGEIASGLLAASKSDEDTKTAAAGEENQPESDLDLLLNVLRVGTLQQTAVTVGATLVVGAVAFRAFDPSLSLVDALYVAVVTVTTVGYGDLVPQSEGARAFVAAYSLFGSLLFLESLGAIAALPLERRRMYQQQVVLEQYGEELDASEFKDLQRTISDLGLWNDERCYCTKADFALAMLLRQAKCSTADVEAALSTFNGLDADGSGELDRRDVEEFWAEPPAAPPRASPPAPPDTEGP